LRCYCSLHKFSYLVILYIMNIKALYFREKEDLAIRFFGKQPQYTFEDIFEMDVDRFLEEKQKVVK